MSEHIRIGLVGYGNLGKGVEAALQQNDDMQLRALFTRRDPSQVQPGCEETPVYHFDSLWKMKDEIDLRSSSAEPHDCSGVQHGRQF